MQGKIQPATKDHLPQLMHILQRVVAAMNAKGNFQWNAMYPGIGHINADIESGSAWVYEYENNPVAYIALNEYQAPEYADVTWTQTKRPLMIHRLFVDPDFEGQGIARAFLTFTVQFAQEHTYSSIRLDAYHENTRSCALYSKSGFTICGSVRFRNRGPFYCFEKNIIPQPRQSEPNQRILSIGSISVDIKAFSYQDNGNEAYRDGTIDLVPGGVARGMAINLTHLGFPCTLLSVVGNDIFGDYLYKGLCKAGIDTALLHVSKTKKTALFSVMASRSHSSCIYCNDVLSEITADKNVYDYIVQNHITVLAIDSNVSEKTLERLYKIKRELNLFVFQNATAPDIARKSLPFVQDIDLFACNEFEAAAILGHQATPDIDTANEFTQLGFKNVIITFGVQGVMVRINGETWNEKPYTTEKIVDTIGAGDAFASGFLCGFLNKKPIKRCIQFGLASAKETLATRQTVCDFLSADMLEYYPDHRA